MDKENSLTALLWTAWGLIPISFDPQSKMQPIAPHPAGSGLSKKKKVQAFYV
jgi:hypothetical protein